MGAAAHSLLLFGVVSKLAAAHRRNRKNRFGSIDRQVEPAQRERDCSTAVLDVANTGWSVRMPGICTAPVVSRPPGVSPLLPASAYSWSCSNP